MKRLSLLLLTVLLTATPVLAASVKVTNLPKVGPALTDAKGMTLYIFTKDTPNQSACSGTCIANWPAFFVEKVEVDKGLAAADFGTITRDDGAKQTTFRGMPLYYFVKDKAAGDASGQGVNGVWFVVDPAKK